MIGSMRNRRFSAGSRWPDKAQSRTRPWNSIIMRGPVPAAPGEVMVMAADAAMTIFGALHSQTDGLPSQRTQKIQ
jgi:hypothetical protein